jgi:clan AA aspartic protease
MGIITTRLTLSNPKENALSPIEVDAIVDTGAMHLCIPQHVALQLQLTELYQREVTVADGRRTLCPYVGPIQVNFGNRGCFTGALVLGDEVLLGAVPMEDMDLVISLARLSIEVNPNSPNIPTSVAREIRMTKPDRP